MLPAKPVKVLVVGGGGREHAICWKLAQSPLVEHIYCAPGNGGTAGESKVSNVSIKVNEFDRLAQFGSDEKIDLFVIGPDNPLADGIVDFLESKGFRVFGPKKEAAQLEWSKTFAKKFMQEHGIPTARFFSTNNREEAIKFARENDWARIVKADGLALGKGVFVCDSIEEVETALADVFDKKLFGEAGNTVLIEERLYGPEMSLLFFCDGKKLEAMPASQDHKRRFDGDKGPNTGGMGVYAPVELFEKCSGAIQEKIVRPFEKAMSDRQIDYVGILYAGLMVVDNEPFVLEYNARFGDPETQAILPLLKSDLLPILWACTEGSLHAQKIEWQSHKSCCVVAAASAYPQSSSRGELIEISQLPPATEVFHAGTKLEGEQLKTDGGRVLAVVGTGTTMESARALAYEGLERVKFKDMDYRKDIAGKALSAARGESK